MNKKISSLCLLVVFCILSFLCSPVSASPVVSTSILGWMTNQNDWFLTTYTVTYCFNIGLYNIFNFNDGGLSFYQCLNQFVKSIKYL